MNPYRAQRLAQEREARSRAGYVWYLVTRSPFYLFWLFWDAFELWLDTRRPKEILFGLPALLAILGALAFLVVGSFHSRDVRMATYRREALGFVANGNFEKASLCYRKLTHMGNADPNVLMEAAMAAGRLGRQAEKEGLMMRLASGPQSYAPAHVFLAQELLQQPGMEESAEQHLRTAIERDPKQPDAHLLLGNMALARKDLDQAILHYREAVLANPLAGLSLAHCHWEKGERALAAAAAKVAGRHLESQREKESHSAATRTRWAIGMAEAMALAGEFMEATTAIEKEYLDSADPSLKAAWAEVYLRWQESLAGGETSGEPAILAQRLALVQAAIGLAPQHPGCWVRVADLAGYRLPVRAFSDENLAALAGLGAMPDLVHFVWGLKALRAQNEPMTDLHLSLAQGINPNSATHLALLGLYLTQARAVEEAQAESFLNWAKKLNPASKQVEEVWVQYGLTKPKLPKLGKL